MMSRNLACGPSVTRGVRPLPSQRKLSLCRAQSGRSVEEPFNEGSYQVRRLVQRDRKELLGNAADILDKYKTEFGDGEEDQPAAAAPAASSSASATATSSSPSSSSPFASSSAPSSSSPFAAGAAPAASPFGSSGAASPFGAAPMRPSRLASVEPKGLSPDMSPDPIVAPPKDTRSWLAKITITQVVLFFSFSTIIGIMIATFFVVLNTGAVRLAGLD